MKKKMKISARFISVILAVLLVIQVIPMQIFATDGVTEPSTESSLEASESLEPAQEEKADVLYEIPEKRDEYSKTYKKSNDTYTAVISASPVNYLENGEWVDIDNTLTAEQKDGQTVYTNTDNPVSIDFPETISDNNKIVVENEGYSIEFSINEINDSTIDIIDTTPIDSGDENTRIIQDDMQKQESSIKYEDVFLNTDVQYTVSSKSIKENIILNSANAIRSSYSFNIEVSGLTAVLNNTKAISFKTQGGEEVFSIPAPVMTDDAMAVSTDIEVALIDNQNGSYTLTYTPSQDWLTSSERVFPIAIDPMINKSGNTNISDTYVLSDHPDDNYESDTLLWAANGITESSTNGVFAETYLKFDLESIYNVMQGITPINVELVLHGSGLNLAVREIRSTCDFSTVTYATKPELYGNIIDYYVGETGSLSESVNFNITKLFSQWLSGERTNNGLAITGFDNTTQTSALLASTENDSMIPKIYIDYVETSGYDDIYDYQTQDVGRAGTSYINNFTRDLFIKRDDISLSGNIMPVTVSFMYNSGLIQKINKAISTTNFIKPNAIYGNGWLSNYNRVLFINNQTGLITYAGENGNIINFTSHEDENGKVEFVEEYSEAIGAKGYSIDVSAIPQECSTNGLEYIKLLTPNGETESFDMLGRLIKIQKTSRAEQAINIHYVTNYNNFNSTNLSNFYAIDYITDGVGRKFQFSYNSDTHLLSQIFCKTADGTEIKVADTATYLRNNYTYTNGNLTRVSYPGLRYADYTYNSDNNLITAASNLTYELGYNYDNNKKIKNVKESARENSSDSYTSGDWLNFENQGPRQTRLWDSDGNIDVLMQFDCFGRNVGNIDNKGNYSYQSYNSSEDSLELSSNGGLKVYPNMLTDNSFENELTGWESTGITTDDIVTTEKHSNTKSLKISSETSATKIISQKLDAFTNNIFTFSAYVKSAETNVSDTLTMEIQLYDSDSSARAEKTREIAAVGGDFARYTVTVEAIDEIYDYVEVSIGLKNSTGEFYVDSLQLENSAGASEYDYLTNGALKGLNNEVTGWTSNSTLSYAYEKILINQNFSTRHFTDNHKYNTNNTLSQTVAINGKQNDALRFGGWVKSYVAFNDGANCSAYENNINFANDRFTGVKLQYSYTVTENGEQVTKTETVTQKINEEVDGWQYVSLSTALKGDCANITVEFVSINNPNTVGAAMFSLNKFESSSVQDNDSGETTPPPSTPDLCVCGENCAFGDGCTCDCTSAEACTCTQCKGCPCESCTQLNCACRCESEEECTCPQCKKKFDITYDDYGNLLSLTINGYDMSTLLSMFTARTYSSNGNYQTSETNENGKSTQYLYNEANGYLKKTTDPRGNDTNYTYNSSGNLTYISENVTGLSGILGVGTSYGYDNSDRLTKIYHNGFSYHIGYDLWGNVTRICVGNINNFTGANNLAEYEYNTGANRRQLKKVTYGNNDITNYTYDTNGNLIKLATSEKVVSNGNTTFTTPQTTIEYLCNSLGEIIGVYDYGTERSIYYNDNSVEIYCSSGLEYYASYDVDGNFYEIINGVKFTSKNYETEKIEETNETVSKSAVTADTGYTLGISKLTDFGGRLKQKTIMSKDPTDTESTNNFAAVLTDYTYKTYTNDNKTMSTGQIDTLKNAVSYGSNMASENVMNRYNYAYDYDDNGNISYEYSVSENGAKTTKYHYVYDEANQLTQVNDCVNGKTYVYLYNGGGNRTSTKVYNGAWANVGTATPIQTINATYGNGTVILAPWNDRLKSYDGKEIKYDAAGNPISYDGKTYEWTGKQLTKVTAADGTYTTYNYDANGLRTKKCQYDANNELQYQVGYLWSDGKIVTQSLGLIVRGTSGGQATETQINIDSKYVYEDGSNSPYAVMLNGGEYLLVRNAQGDVTAVIDGANGETLIEYQYDAWGQVTITYGEDTNDLLVAIINVLCPLTYRGYNYDFTTGLYYLQSRYYNPEWGRFLNVDDVKILTDSVGDPLAANMYAYCNNNPVNNVDYTGYFTKQYHYNTPYGLYRNKFGDVLANQLATGCRDIDILYPSTSHFYSKYYQSFHFNIYSNERYKEDSRLTRTKEMMNNAFLMIDKYADLYKTYKLYLNWHDSYKAKNIKLKLEQQLKNIFYEFGKALHPVMDMIAHSGPYGNIKSSFGFYYHRWDQDKPDGILYDNVNGKYIQTEYTKNEACLFILVVYGVVIEQSFRERGVNYYFFT